MSTQRTPVSSLSDTTPDARSSTSGLDDTIAAIATPPGVGGVGIVRVSGSRAFQIGQRIFRPARPLAADTPASHLLVYGHIVDPATDEPIDEVLAAFLRQPHTYTREDVVEINAHGGPLVLRRILELTFAEGARAARAGEMTLRAFLNGRVDLAQAEAVMSLIAAESDAGRRLALRQLEGDLSRRVEAARDAAQQALVRIEASIDFPEEEVPPPDPAELASFLGTARDEVGRLLAGADRGRILRNGLRVALVGKPNVGKSSLLNALLGAERAIVTPIAGTTRDTVEEKATVAGVVLHLVDTAGLAQTDDPIERIGVERSREAARTADLVLFVFDGSAPLTEADERAASTLAEVLGADGNAAPVILVRNKSDLPQAGTPADAHRLWSGALDITTSARAPGGLAQLETLIAELVTTGQATAGDVLVSSARHRDALRRASEHLDAALAALTGSLPLDFVAIDIRAALEALGEITGETATADLLDRIFAEFCIGK